MVSLLHLFALFATFHAILAEINGSCLLATQVPQPTKALDLTDALAQRGDLTDAMVAPEEVNLDELSQGAHPSLDHLIGESHSSIYARFQQLYKNETEGKPSEVVLSVDAATTAAEICGCSNPVSQLTMFQNGAGSGRMTRPKFQNGPGSGPMTGPKCRGCADPVRQLNEWYHNDLTDLEKEEFRKKAAMHMMGGRSYGAGGGSDHHGYGYGGDVTVPPDLHSHR